MGICYLIYSYNLYNNLQDFTPDKQSILAVNDYRSIKELASHMEKIASSEEEYESYRQFKKKGGVTNQLLKKTLEQREWEPDQDVELNINRVKPNFPELFQCKVCEMMHNVTKGEDNFQCCPSTISHPRRF